MKRLACVIAMLLCVCFAGNASGKDLTGHTTLQFVRNLYNMVRNTLPSEVNAEENTEAITSRLKCYEENHAFAQRIQICNNRYIKRIVYLARKGIRSRPDLGEFVLNVDMCPILYNLCMGQTENDKDRCILFERQCIDYTLDRFWRGSAQYTQKTYRLDQ